MVGLVLGALVAGLFLFVLLSYGADRISNRRDLTLAAAFAGFMALVVLASGLGLLAHAADLQALQENEPLSSREDLLGWSGPGPMVVTAVISPDMPAALADYVAYVEEEEGGFEWRPALELVLDDGRRVWTTADYDAANWGFEFDTSFVRAGDPAVVIGRAVSGELDAEVLFRGRYEDFEEKYLPGRRAEASISLALAAVIGVGGLILGGLALGRIGLRWKTLAAGR